MRPTWKTEIRFSKTVAWTAVQSEHRDECRAQSGKHTDWQPEHPIIIFKYSHNLFKTSNTVPKFFSLLPASQCPILYSFMQWNPFMSDSHPGEIFFGWFIMVSFPGSRYQHPRDFSISVHILYLVIYCLLELLLVYGVNIQHKYGCRQVSHACGWDAFNSFATISNIEIIIELVPRLRLKYCFI